MDLEISHEEFIIIKKKQKKRKNERKFKKHKREIWRKTGNMS